MHDGAPAHFARAVRRRLTRKYGQRWMGGGGPVPWPPRSPDLNPVDYCVWSQVRSLVYTSAVDTVEELQHRIEGVCQQIRNEPGVTERIRNSMRRRVQCCVQMQGQRFEHLL
jgi:transposase